MTEAADQFGQPVLADANQSNQNKELKNYLKGHHFDIGFKGSRTTQNKAQTFGRAEPTQGAQTGVVGDRANAEFKKDQQKAHFNFGFD